MMSPNGLSRQAVRTKGAVIGDTVRHHYDDRG